MNQISFSSLAGAAQVLAAGVAVLTLGVGGAAHAESIVTPSAIAGSSPALHVETARNDVKAPAAGGPYEPLNGADAAASDIRADQQFRTLFTTWKKLDNAQQGSIAIPSVQPVEHLSFTSNFGVRTDPFRGTAAFHPGVDIQGAVGTPVYATADGFVDRTGRAGGYGNLVEIDHGKGIQTRYGHLSKILVAPYTRVHRGQLIGLIGSTGRSTGPHLHYEVRIDGAAVNPVPFLQNADYFTLAHANPTIVKPVATGGPATPESAD